MSPIKPLSIAYIQMVYLNERIMRSILRITITLAIISIAGQTIAQDAKKTLLQTEQMAAKLGLSEKQKTALDKELKANQESRKATMEKMKALREEVHRDAFVERQARMERMKSILTPEQWQVYQKTQKEGRRQLQGFRGQRGRNNVNGQRGRAGQHDSLQRGQVRKKRVIMRKRATEKKLKEKKENGGDGGN